MGTRKIAFIQPNRAKRCVGHPLALPESLHGHITHQALPVLTAFVTSFARLFLRSIVNHVFLEQPQGFDVQGSRGVLAVVPTRIRQAHVVKVPMPTQFRQRLCYLCCS